MSLSLLAAALNDNELLVAGGAALFVTLAIARGWSRESTRWGRIIAHLRGENRALREQNWRLANRIAELEAAARARAAPETPGADPGPQAGGPGRTDGS